MLRLGAGAALWLCDGHGRCADATVVQVGPGGVELEVGNVAEAPQLPLELTVALAPPKGERADWVVEKLTELGVATIVWLETEHGVRRVRSEGARTPRWQRLAEAAASQCGRASVPAIVGPLSFDAFLDLRAERRFIGDRSAAAAAAARLALATSALLGVGPEGGFADAELAAAAAAGFERIRFGPTILRTETAAVAGATLLMGLADAAGPKTP